MIPQVAYDSIASEHNAMRPATAIQCVRRVQFCAGHRVWKHESKCAHLHGHNYVVFFHATAESLDGLGRVIDFSELKSRLGGWIEENWDHGFILNRNDHEAIEAVTAIPRQKLYLLDSNPTAENLAQHLLTVVSRRQMDDAGVHVVKVVMCETENSYAEAEL